MATKLMGLKNIVDNKEKGREGSIERKKPDDLKTIQEDNKRLREQVKKQEAQFRNMHVILS